MSFETAIKGQLEIKFKSETYKVPGGDLKEIKLELSPWGFEGMVSFLVMCDQKPDKLRALFIGDDAISVNLELETALVGPGEGTAKPWKLAAEVCHRAYTEETAAHVESKQNPVIFRVYTIYFEDPASFYWKRHFPLELYTDSDLKTAIEKQKPQDLKLKIDWSDVLGKKHPQVLLPTAFQNNESASFYDFICWLTERNYGFFYFDYATSEYVLSGQRQDKGDAKALPRMKIQNYSVSLPTPDYAKPVYMNGNAKDASSQDGENSLAVKPLNKDYLTISPTPSQFSQYVSDKKKNFKQPGATLDWDYAQLPTTWPLPGELYKFTSDTWSSDAYMTGKSFRIKVIEFMASTPNRSDLRPTYGEPSAAFDVSLKVKAETKEKIIPVYPAYVKPLFPVKVEGYVFSDKEDEKKSTYVFAEDSDTKERYYQVEIPLWKKQKVRVPYVPQELNGQFYFPPYKKQRVVLALELTTATIASYIDWRDYSTLPMDGQGNHIVMGKAEKSMTSIKHDYKDNKPQLDIVRTLEKDTETISIGEGYIRLHTKEEK